MIDRSLVRPAAEPTDNYPDLFTAPGAPLAGAAPFLATYPYVLPSLLSVAFALSAFVLGLFRCAALLCKHLWRALLL